MPRRTPWLALVALALFSTTAAAARAAEPWELTGHALIDAGLDGSLAPEIDAPGQPELKVMVSASRAGAYLLGAAQRQLPHAVVHARRQGRPTGSASGAGRSQRIARCAPG